ncbi:MAG: hypothetical protein R3362_07680, partial [Rhodothermales bacterium]|nr:hypothetical protein [Rhodothermales bacterium]
MPAGPAYQLVALDVPDAGALRVLVLAEDPLVRAGLGALVEGLNGVTVAGPAAPADSFEAAREAFEPDVVLWDVGEAAPDEALADLPAVALVRDEDAVAEAWAAGARGLLLRDELDDVLVPALVAVARGLVVVDPALAEAVLALPGRPAEPLPEPLTPREHEVLALLAEGLPN